MDNSFILRSNPKEPNLSLGRVNRERRKPSLRFIQQLDHHCGELGRDLTGDWQPKNVPQNCPAERQGEGGVIHFPMLAPVPCGSGACPPGVEPITGPCPCQNAQQVPMDEMRVQLKFHEGGLTALSPGPHGRS